MLRLAGVLILAATTAWAEMPKGANEKPFQKAVTTWLDGDDENSLPELSRLASAGSEAAQILLARIEFHPSNTTKWLRSLSRDQRVSIFRAQDGRFGKSWLRAASEGSELARAFDQSGYLDDPSAALAKLITLKEYNEAYFVAGLMFGKARHEDIVETIPPEVQDESLQRIAKLARLALNLEAGHGADVFRDTHMKTILGDAIPPDMNVHSDFLSWILVGTAPRQSTIASVPDTVVDAVRTSEVAEPLANYCERNCPMTARECYRFGHSAIKGLSGLRKIGSPVETLILQERYLASQRAELELLAGMSFSSNRGVITDVCLQSKLTEFAE